MSGFQPCLSMFPEKKKHFESMGEGREELLLFGMLFTHLVPSFLLHNPQAIKAENQIQTKAQDPVE